MTYEPPLDDDVALDKDIEEQDDGYQEPDRMWGDEWHYIPPSHTITVMGLPRYSFLYPLQMGY